MKGYNVIELLHESSRFSVIRALRLTDNKSVILKVAKQEIFTPKAKKKLDDEFHLANQVQSDYVIHFLALEEYAPHRWTFIQEDIVGISLAQAIPAQGFEVKTFLTIARQIAAGLQAIHQQGIIHKDIKPSNIVIQPDTNHINIIDFSSAVQLKQINQAVLPLISGTLAYIAPEQTGRINRHVDYRTDFYAFGITCYQLVTGQLPFRGTDPLNMIHQHIAKRAIEPHLIKKTIPVFLSQLIMKLMAKNPEERYQSSLGILHDLNACLTALQTSQALAVSLIGSHDVAEKFTLPQTLYGRAHELEVLLNTFKRTSMGSVEALMVTGYAGIGKTALINEIQPPLTLKKGYFITGKFDQLAKGTAYSALIQALQDLMAQLLAESEIQFTHWQQQLQAAVGNNGQLLINIIPELEKIIGQQPPVPGLGLTETKNRFNHVFISFLSAFAQLEHPLVLFLDDLQWADVASLELIKSFMTEPDTQYFLLIGAYRDSEVDTLHPTTLALEDLRKAQIPVQTITLTPLSLSTVTTWLADTTYHDLTTIKPLAALVYQKTDGNPFFINMFLQALYDDGLLTITIHKGWQWDITKIAQQPATENVVGFMLSRLQQLPTLIQNLLAQASCLGNHCSLDLLEKVAQCPQNTLIDTFQSVFNLGLAYEKDEHFYFAHDRIQEAAYSLLTDNEKKQTHLRIGRLLREQYSAQTEAIFDIVDQFNKSRELINDQNECVKVAQLNLMAAKRAKNAIAYQIALNYINMSFTYLAERDLWTYDYPLAFALYKEAAELEYLNGHFNASYGVIKQMLTFINNPIDRAEINTLLVVQKTLQTDYSNAIQLGCDSLKELGIELSEANLKTVLQQEAAYIQQQLQHRNINDLLSLPIMNEPEKIAAAKLLFHLIAPTYLINPELYFMIGLKTVRLSLEYGHTPEICAGYATYGLLLCTLAKYQLGYDFGQLALTLSEKFQSNRDKARVTTTFTLLIYHWAKPILSIKTISKAGYQAGIESGELQAAGYIHFGMILHSFYQGECLADIVMETSRCLVFLERTKSQVTMDTVRAVQLAIDNLIKPLPKNANPLRNIMNHSDFENACIEHGSFSSLGIYHIYKAQVLYLLGYYAPALNCIVAAQKNLSYISGLISNATYNQYYSLILLQLYPEQAEETQKTTLMQLEKNQAQLLGWAKSCPENFLHWHTLINAEMARIQQRHWEALQLYTQAIDLAHIHQYTQDEALACELASLFYQAHGQEKVAQSHLRQAYHLYKDWGATAKVQQLEVMYPHLRPSVITPKMSASTLGIDSTMYLDIQRQDLQKILKASQSISSDVDLPKFLQTVMAIMVEHAGAEKGTFFTIEGECAIVMAQSEAQQINIRSLTLADWQQGARSVVQYVKRTQQPLILDDAYQASKFKTDIYIQAQQTKSILAMPINLQGALKAILYLENNLTSHAFTPYHFEVLTLLAHQIAISFENVKLYEAKKQSEQRYRTLAETTHAVIWSADATGHFVTPQALWAKFTGQNWMQYQGLGWLNAIHGDDRTRVTTALANAIDAKTPFQELIKIRAQEGYYKYLILHAIPLLNENSDIIEWIGTCLDIHALKQAEEQLRITSNNLNLALDSANIGTWSWDLVSNKVEIDANIFTLFDLNPATYQFTLSEIFATIHPEDREKIDLLLKQSIAEKTPYEAEYRIIKKDNSIHYISARGKAFYQNDQPQCMTGTAWDITQEKERQHLQEAEAYRQKLEEYIDTICHEIRNPLNGIYGGIDMLATAIQALEHLLAQKNRVLSKEMEQTLAEQLIALKETLENLSICSEQQKIIVDDVLDLSKIERNKLELQTVIFSPKKAILKAMHMFSQTLRKKQIKLNLIAPDKVFYVAADEGRFTQIVINLLSNASKFTLQGSITISLTHELMAENKVQLEVHVKDTGIGMTPSEVNRLFQPFSQANSRISSQFGGTGLGLTISKKLSTLMGGTIGVSSEQGRGSDFYFTIVALPAEQPALIEQPAFLPLDTLNTIPSQRILIVEDNFINQKVLMRQLEKLGHTYVIAANGLEALQYYQERPFDIVLMDIEMPVMNGLEATQQIRQYECKYHKARVPIIGLSGNARSEQIERALQAGMDGYITKPFHQQTLLEQIKKAISLRQQPVKVATLSTSPLQTPSLSFFNSVKTEDDTAYVTAFKREADKLLAQHYPFSVQSQNERLTISLSSASTGLPSFCCELLLKELSEHLHTVFSALEITQISLTSAELQLAMKNQKQAELVQSVLSKIGFELTIQQPEQITQGIDRK